MRSRPHDWSVSPFGAGLGSGGVGFFAFWKLSLQLLLDYVYSTLACYSWWNINDGVDSEGCKINLVLELQRRACFCLVKYLLLFQWGHYFNFHVNFHHLMEHIILHICTAFEEVLEHNTETVLLLNLFREQHCQFCSLRLWRQARQRSDTTRKMGKSRIYTNTGPHSFRNGSFLSWASRCSMSESFGAWRLTFVQTYWLSDHPAPVSLANLDVGFLLAAGWWLKRRWVILPYHRDPTMLRG